jgi:hypothetical protein
MGKNKFESGRTGVKNKLYQYDYEINKETNSYGLQYFMMFLF